MMLDDDSKSKKKNHRKRDRVRQSERERQREVEQEQEYLPFIRFSSRAFERKNKTKADRQTDRRTAIG